MDQKYQLLLRKQRLEYEVQAATTSGTLWAWYAKQQELEQVTRELENAKIIADLTR